MTTKPWLFLATTTFVVGLLVAKLRSAVSGRVPVGYQDERGFHFGTEQGD